MSTYFIRQNVLFLVFILIAAPLQFNLALYYGHVSTALLEGSLYFFAVVAAAEAWMRLENHPEVASAISTLLMKLLCAIPLVLFALDFLPAKYGSATPTPRDCHFQIPAAVLSLGISVVVHFYLSWLNRQPTAQEN